MKDTKKNTKQITPYITVYNIGDRAVLVTKMDNYDYPHKMVDLAELVECCKPKMPSTTPTIGSATQSLSDLSLTLKTGAEK